MSNEKIKDLSTVVWINLILGLYNLYCFSVGHMIFNLIVGALNVGVWVFFRKPQTVALLSGSKSYKEKND